MIRIAKVTSVSYPNPHYPDDATKDSMHLVFAPGQPMATRDWADIYEGMPAHPSFIQIDADRNPGYQVVQEPTKSTFFTICNLSIWTDDAGLICMEGDTYINGTFFNHVKGPVAYIIGSGGTLFLPAKKVTDNDIVP